MSNLISVLPCALSVLAALAILFNAIGYPQVRFLPAKARSDTRFRRPNVLKVTRQNESYSD